VGCSVLLKLHNKYNTFLTTNKLGEDGRIITIKKWLPTNFNQKPKTKGERPSQRWTVASPEETSFIFHIHLFDITKNKGRFK
jgi:hypothetical protein